jgi:N-acetylglutamate synthase-like GNAT family acetyltransferase
MQNYSIRLAKTADIPIIADLDSEAFGPYGTSEDSETFHARLLAFPGGFIVLVIEKEIAAYGCSEKWLMEREPGLNENPLETHHPNGTVFCITGMAVRIKYRNRGYGLALLDHLIEIARREGCKKIVLETTHAQDLYLKRDFQIVQSREDRGIHLDIMTLELEGP